MNIEKVIKWLNKERSDHVEKQFKKESKKILKEISTDIGLKVGSYDIEEVMFRDNPGVSLKADGFNVVMHLDPLKPVALCKNNGRKDLNPEVHCEFGLNNVIEGELNIAIDELNA